MFKSRVFIWSFLKWIAWLFLSSSWLMGYHWMVWISRNEILWFLVVVVFWVFFTVTLVGLPFCFKKSCKWKKKIMGDNLCHFKQLKSLDIRYYHYTCHYIQFTKKSNSFRCTCTSPVWVMEHFAVSHHVVLCIYLS